MLKIALKEIRSLAVSPLSWVVMAVVQALLAYVFLFYLDDFIRLQAEQAKTPLTTGLTQWVVAPLFLWTTGVFLFVTPLLTMRLISEELRSGTLTLLLSSPTSMLSIILGKFFGMLCFIYLMLCMIALMPLSLLGASTLDFGLFFSGFMGLILVVTSFTAVGLFMSSLTAHPTVAAVSSFGITLFLCLMELSVKAEGTSTLYSYISMLHHYTTLMRGIFNSSDIVYFLIFIVIFLSLSVRRLESIRLSP